MNRSHFAFLKKTDPCSTLCFAQLGDFCTTEKQMIASCRRGLFEVLNFIQSLTFGHDVSMKLIGNCLHCEQLSSTVNREVPSRTRLLLMLTRYLKT